MTVRKRQSTTAVPQPLRKKVNLAQADKDGLRKFLESAYSGLDGYEEAARER